MTKSRHFVVEPRPLDDESDGSSKGWHLPKFLLLSGSHGRCIYPRKMGELEDAINPLADSGYLYLQLSCHGGKSDFESRIRMLGTTSNPPAHKLVTVIGYLERHAGLTMRVTARSHLPVHGR